jgi:hypothetical protein
VSPEPVNVGSRLARPGRRGSSSADSGGRLPPAGLPTPICSFRSRIPAWPLSRRWRPKRSARPAGFGANAWRSRCGRSRSTASGAARPSTSSLRLAGKTCPHLRQLPEYPLPRLEIPSDADGAVQDRVGRRFPATKYLLSGTSRNMTLTNVGGTPAASRTLRRWARCRPGRRLPRVHREQGTNSQFGFVCLVRCPAGGWLRQ